MAQAFALVSMPAAAASGVRLEYSGRVSPGSELVGRIGRWVDERNAARRFRALADETERRSAAIAGHALPAPR